VNNGAAPVITVTGPVDFCSNSPVTTTLFCTGSTSYTWSAPINTVSPLVVITQTAASAVYTVMAQSAGCTAVKEVTVSINPLPSVSVTASKPTVCTNATGGTAVALTGSPAGGVYSGPNVSGSNFTPGSAAGTFTAVYSYTNTSTGCSNTANTSIIVANCTGFSSPTANASLMVFPNPSLHGKLKLSHLYGTNTIEVINVLGQVVLKAQSNQEEVELDLSHQANGNYFIKVSASDGSVKTVKIVNQN
jgi:hypothetical protein